MVDTLSYCLPLWIILRSVHGMALICKYITLNFDLWNSTEHCLFKSKIKVNWCGIETKIGASTHVLSPLQRSHSPQFTEYNSVIMGLCPLHMLHWKFKNWRCSRWLRYICRREIWCLKLRGKRADPGGIPNDDEGTAGAQSAPLKSWESMSPF